MMVQTFVLFSQEGKKTLDTLTVRQDSVRKDTILTNILKPSPNAIDKQVTYKAAGY